MIKKFNFIIAAYLASFALMLGEIKFDQEFDNKLSEFFANYNIIYNADYPKYVIIIYLLSSLLTIISAISMLFRVQYSNYIFVFFTAIGYSSYIFEVDTIYVSTIREDLYSSLCTLFEGALIALIMFNDDIGFKKGTDEN